MKQKYYVYKEETQSYEPTKGVNSKTSTLVGETYAVSSKQAVNNYMYRNHLKPSDLYCEGLYGYERQTKFIATTSKKVS